MKKLLSLVFLVTTIAAVARQVSPDEAAAIASEFLNSQSVKRATGRVTVQRAKPDNHQAEAPYYVFNADDNHGFVIVSGDDKARKILGYSDTGTFDFNNLPPQLQWLLNQYEEEILDVCASGSGYQLDKEEKSDDRQSIAPMVKSQWGQGGIFSNNCPVVDGEHAPAGCVPVAIAQIMNFHKWPEKGEETYTYQHYDGQTFYYDFQNTSFAWNLIQDAYDEESSEESIAEVAKLLQAVGYALNTQYCLSIGSSSHIAFAKRGLVENLKYDTNARIIWRNNYRLKEWEDLIYSELLAVRPVYVQGDNHAFVCDGYSSSGLFHFNWGWGGDFDGFFSFSALTPNVDNYSRNISALINIHKRDGERKDLTYDIISHGYFEYIPQTGEITVSSLNNYTTKIFEGWIGCEYVNSETQKSFYCPSNICSINKVDCLGIYTMMSSADATFFAKKDTLDTDWSSPYGDFHIEFDIVPGSYTLYPALNFSRTINDDAWHRLSCVVGAQSHIDLVVDKDYNFHYSNPGPEASPDIEITDIWINMDEEERVNSVWAHEQNFILCFMYINHSDFPVSKVTYRIYDEMGNFEGENDYTTTIEPNCAGKFSFLNNIIDLEPGRHEIRVFDITGKQINNTPYWFEAKKRDYNLEVTDIKVVGDANIDYVDIVQFECVIHNNSEESVSPILRYKFKNGIGETFVANLASAFEPNSSIKIELQKECGFLVGECTLELFEPYGNQINETYTHQFPWPKVVWIGFIGGGGAIHIGESLQLEAVIVPEYAGNRILEWTSDNPSVATVDSNGKVIGIAAGEAHVTAAATDGSGVKATCIVEVIGVPGDVDGNGAVDGMDLNVMISGVVSPATSTLTPATADMNGDGVIDGLDLNALITNIINNQK